MERVGVLASLCLASNGQREGRCLRVSINLLYSEPNIVVPSVAAQTFLGGSTGLALGKPTEQQMAPQCV